MVQKTSKMVLNNFFPLSFERETQGFYGRVLKMYTLAIFDRGEWKCILYKHCGMSTRFNLATDLWGGGNNTKNLVV